MQFDPCAPRKPSSNTRHEHLWQIVPNSRIIHGGESNTARTIPDLGVLYLTVDISEPPVYCGPGNGIDWDRRPASSVKLQTSDHQKRQSDHSKMSVHLMLQHELRLSTQSISIWCLWSS